MIDTPPSHTIVVNAAEQDHLIDTVTVFQAGRAEVRRRVQLQLKKGQNQIAIERLPSCLAEDSLRVQGTGTATIFDVVYHHPKPQLRRKHTQAITHSSDEEEEETESYNSIEVLKKQRSVVQNQISFLDKYGHSVDSQNSNTESLERFLDMYETRRDALDRRMHELNLEVNRAEKALRVMYNKKPGREIKGQRRTKITVTVMSDEEGKAELMLVYVVSNASWIPNYEIRALVSSLPNSPSTITLHYRASLTQTTGEDWSDVALTLSTATPYRGVNMPTLSTWRVGLPPTDLPPTDLSRYTRNYSQHISSHSLSAVPCSLDYAPRARPRSRSRSRSRSPTRIDSYSAGQVFRPNSYLSKPDSSLTPCSPTPMEESAFGYSARSSAPFKVMSATTDSQDGPAPMAFRQVNGIDTGVLSATFNIPGQSNIPSNQGTHKVLITSLDFQVDPEWCKVINSSEFTLLPGEASVFIGNSFVSKSQIGHIPPGDSFQLPLGTDPTLRVAYAPIHTHKWIHAQSGFTFPGLQKQPKQETTKYSQLITIRNNRPTAVTALNILDHVPVSNDSTIKVNVTSPQGLRGNNKPVEDDTNEQQREGWVFPQKGVQARWAPPSIGGEGAIEWMCTIDAGEGLELKLGWEIHCRAKWLHHVTQNHTNPPYQPNERDVEHRNNTVNGYCFVKYMV
ncbi:unnamed protein product [Rhizoctonia solani]|uniref:Protein F37C4,5 [Caenorhabditis elegans] n=1 Tax=Rhizoctonia solani TaxID=456999 RepID=A0A8H2Y2U3_9AGAM|nr:unnamed protein product [Rhizoctonia solani]